MPAQSAARRGFTHAPPTAAYTLSLAGGKKSPDRLAGAEKADVRSIICACMVAVSFSSVRLRTNRRRTPGGAVRELKVDHRRRKSARALLCA